MITNSAIETRQKKEQWEWGLEGTWKKCVRQILKKAGDNIGGLHRLVRTTVPIMCSLGFCHEEDESLP